MLPSSICSTISPCVLDKPRTSLLIETRALPPSPYRRMDERVDAYPVNRTARAQRRKLLNPTTTRALIIRHNDMALTCVRRQLAIAIQPASIDANRSDCGTKRGEEFMRIRRGNRETYPFCSSTSLRPATCQTIPLTLYSQNINKEPATQRARSKYNVPPDLPSLLLPRFTAFLVLHDPYHRASSFFPRNFTFSLSRSCTFTFSSFLSLFVFHSPPSRCVPLLFLFVSSSLFGQLLCIVREPSARS